MKSMGSATTHEIDINLYTSEFCYLPMTILYSSHRTPSHLYQVVDVPVARWTPSDGAKLELGNLFFRTPPLLYLFFLITGKVRIILCPHRIIESRSRELKELFKGLPYGGAKEAPLNEFNFTCRSWNTRKLCIWVSGTPINERSCLTSESFNISCRVFMVGCKKGKLGDRS